MIRQLTLLLLSGAIALMAGVARAETLKVSLLLSDDSAPYRQIADAFNKALAAENADVAVAETQAGNTENGKPHTDLIVAVGMKATEMAVAKSDAPVLAVLAVMVPESGLRQLRARYFRQKTPGEFSAIYLNQPWDRQIDFMQAALPKRSRIGLLYSPDTPLDIDALRRLVARRGGVLVAQPVKSADQLYPALESVLANSDVLLAIPDNAIYSSGNIRNTLLTSYRHGVPLIGLSQSYVNAGALCAVFSTPEQIAGQAAVTVMSFARNKRLPDPQHPSDFTVAVNEQVARSLGIQLPSPETIRNKMGKMGRWE